MHPPQAAEPPSLPEFGKPEHLVLIAQNYVQLTKLRLTLFAEMCRYGINPNSASFDEFLDRLTGDDGLDFAQHVTSLLPKEDPSEDEELFPGASLLDDTPMNPSEEGEASPSRPVLSEIAENLTEEEAEMLFSRLPESEASVFRAYYQQGKTQAEIAQERNMTQGGISYRMERGRARIRFLRDLPKLTPEGIREALSQRLPPIDIDILIGMYLTTCQSETARRLGLTQGRVKHRFDKLVRHLNAWASSGLVPKPYAVAFESISKNLNLFHEVISPRWGQKGEGHVD